jgi:ATP-binding protein involved in chromosome partitioning
MPKPTEVRRILENALRITWSDGLVVEVDSRLLRTDCPCAECRELRGDTSHAKPLSSMKKSSLRVIEASADEQLRLLDVWGVGNYAIGMAWGDGHRSGIYNFSQLREICEKKAAQAQKQSSETAVS